MSKHKEQARSLAARIPGAELNDQGSSQFVNLPKMADGSDGYVAYTDDDDTEAGDGLRHIELYLPPDKIGTVLQAAGWPSTAVPQ